MERNFQKIGLVNLVIFLVLGLAGFATARYAQSSAGQIAMLFVGMGFLVACVSWFQMRLEESERLEKLELEELARSKASSTLFESKDAEIFPAQRSREQFERFFVPGFTILLCVLQGAGAWWSWWTLNKITTPQEVKNPLVALGVFAFLFLLAFLFGKYSATSARLEKVRLLRPGAGYLLFTAYVALIVTGGVAAVEAGFPKTDYYVARCFAVLLGVVGAETLVNLILEIYRPRMKGKISRPLYESRLVGLIGTPEGLVTTAAQAMDYQFGFKVSDTWFYRFLERSLGWIILVQVIILLLSTCIVFIEPGEQGLIERFGKAVTNRAVLEPGPHFKWPWPIDKVYRFHTHEVQTVNIGFIPDPARESDPTILWTVPHYKEEFNLLVANRDSEIVTTNQSPSDRAVPVNLLTLSIPLQYEVSDVRAWFYNHEDTDKFLQQIATREVVRYLAGADLSDIMTTRREEGANDLRRLIQSEADRLHLGINILFLGLQDIHPPTKVADSYEAVVGAQQEIEAKVLKAEGEAARTTLLAHAESTTRVRDAEGAAIRRKSDAAAMGAQFTNQITAYDAEPDVYMMRTRLLALAQYGANARKYVIAPTNTTDVIQINLEDSIASDLLKINVGESK